MGMVVVGAIRGWATMTSRVWGIGDEVAVRWWSRNPAFRCRHGRLGRASRCDLRDASRVESEMK